MKTLIAIALVLLTVLNLVFINHNRGMHNDYQRYKYNLCLELDKFYRVMYYNIGDRVGRDRIRDAWSINKEACLGRYEPLDTDKLAKNARFYTSKSIGEDNETIKD